MFQISVTINYKNLILVFRGYCRIYEYFFVHYSFIVRFTVIFYCVFIYNSFIARLNFYSSHFWNFFKSFFFYFSCVDSLVFHSYPLWFQNHWLVYSFLPYNFYYVFFFSHYIFFYRYFFLCQSFIKQYNISKPLTIPSTWIIISS